jgi:hypothetical protein
MFHPRANVIRGQNGTGKSSLIKSLYWTLGAEPAQIHPRWREANVFSSLRFSVDDSSFRAIRLNNRVCIFDSCDKLIGSFDSITKDLTPYFAELFAFHLSLSTSSDDAPAVPAFLFLPFYLDQDAGWTAPHASFDRLSQYRSPRKDTLEFHTGIRPSEFYIAKAQKKRAELDAQPLRNERETLKKITDDIQVRLATTVFDIDISAYEAEIESLLKKSNRLRDIEESKKQRMAEAFEYKRSLVEQRAAVESALHELRADRAHAAILHDPVICPTCHALYPNGFAERFEIAMDEDTCIALLAELKNQDGDANRRLEEARISVEESQVATQQIQDILSAKQGEVALSDILRCEGRKDVADALRQQIGVLDQRIGQLDGNAFSATEDMKAFESKPRRSEILEFYRKEMARLLLALNVRNLSEKSYRDLNCTIKESGSDLPRAVLAYFFATIHTIHEYSTSTLCPLVVDSPHQQDQDPENWKRILQCIQTETHENTQLILGTTTDTGFDFGGSVIDLSTKNFLLQENEYASVNDELMPLIEAGLK